jgi:hypothetical protein
LDYLENYIVVIRKCLDKTTPADKQQGYRPKNADMRQGAVAAEMLIANSTQHL